MPVRTAKVPKGPEPLHLLDVRALAAHDLPQRNRMSVLVRLETAESPEVLLETLREALAWLGGDELGPVFVSWVSEVLMPLRFPDADRTPFEDLQEGVTMLAERAKGWTEEWFAQGQRAMAVRMARLRFGDGAAEQLSPLLDRIADHAVLAEVGDGVIQCRDGEELLARAEAVAGFGNDQPDT